MQSASTSDPSLPASASASATELTSPPSDLLFLFSDVTPLVTAEPQPHSESDARNETDESQSKEDAEEKSSEIMEKGGERKSEKGICIGDKLVSKCGDGFGFFFFSFFFHCMFVCLFVCGFQLSARS